MNLKLVFFAFLLPFFIPNIAFSAGAATDGLQGALCAGYGFFSGGVGKTFGIFAIVALGIALFLGKASWGLAVSVAIGIGLLFGAPKIVNMLAAGSGSSAAGCNTDGSVSAA
jgi:type IV secretion system protein VirB2